MGVLRFVEPHTPVDTSIELTTSVTVLRLFRDALASLGADWEQILGLCDIAPEELDDCEARIAQHRIERIWTVACEVTRDPCIGLHAARVEARIGLEEILARSPGYEASAERAEPYQTEFVKGLAKLPIRLA